MSGERQSGIIGPGTLSEDDPSFPGAALTRPKWCPNRACQTLTKHDVDEGFGSSGWCTGRVELPMVTVRGGVRHENDCYFCWRTPRGITMFEVNEGDFQIVARVALRALVALKPSQVFNWRWFTGRPEPKAAGTQTKGECPESVTQGGVGDE